MKFVASQIAYFLQKKSARRNIKFLFGFLIALAGIITIYSILFHYISILEGERHSWLTGFYWTLTVMTTLGFGDITFTSDIGRFYSIVVLVSGVFFLLVLLPFTFIQFFYAPWIEAQNRNRAPKKIPDYFRNHVIITAYNEITISLIEKLKRFKYEYVLLLSDLNRALELYDLGYFVALGELDNPETYKNMQIDKALLVVAANTDEVNTNIAFTVREVNENIQIITTADSTDSLDILDLAGSNLTIQPSYMLGQALARRTIGGEAISNRIGKFEELIIAEAPAMGTPLVGKTLQELQLRSKIGINVVGIWEKGKFNLPFPNTLISNSSVLVIAGDDKQIMNYDEYLVIFETSYEPVIIIGNGRVGKAVAETLELRNINFTIIEKDPAQVTMPEKTIIGNAADLSTLEKANFYKAPAVIISTNNDDMNIYLTIYCRRLKKEIQIVSRANMDKNVSTLHRAGANLVMSYASLSANTIFNYFSQNQTIMLSEGLDIFKVIVPELLVGKSLIETDIRNKTGCSVIAIKINSQMMVNPDPTIPIEYGSELFLIGDKVSENKFLEIYK